MLSRSIYVVTNGPTYTGSYFQILSTIILFHLIVLLFTYFPFSIYSSIFFSSFFYERRKSPFRQVTTYTVKIIWHLLNIMPFIQYHMKCRFLAYIYLYFKEVTETLDCKNNFNMLAFCFLVHFMVSFLP